MKRNTVILFMSPFTRMDKFEYKDVTGRFSSVCCHTNETALKYISWKLACNNEKIDAVYAIVTKEVKSKNTLEDFKKLFAEETYPFVEIPLQNEDLQGSLKSISKMFDAFSEKELQLDNEVTVHVDMTGGFRHASVLLLVLLQVLQYVGAQMGLVIYTNYQKKRVEEAGELIKMFNLIGGTAEFAEHGNVGQLKKYFPEANEISPYLQNLLFKMENISERIKICTKLEELKEAGRDLSNAMEIYKQFLCSKNASLHNEQEIFFAKLLPTIEKEYKEILSYEEPQIIRWCVKKGLLQQALIFYTEWLPVYLFNKRMVTVNDPSVIEECTKNSKMWSSWQVYFFKSFQYLEKKDQADIKINDSEHESAGEKIEENLSYEKLIEALKYFKETNTIDIERYKNFTKFYGFLKRVKSLETMPRVAAINFVLNLLADDVIKMIIRQNKPKEMNLETFLSVRMKKLNNDILRLILLSLQFVKRETIAEWFDLNEDSDKQKEKVSRKIVFKSLLRDGVIDINLPEGFFLDTVEEYATVIITWRNHASHAASDKNESITTTLLERLNNIEKFANNLN